MKIRLAYFNLVFIVGYFVVELILNSLNTILAIGLVIALWYNWETLKRLNGQRSILNKFNILIGVIVLLFAALVASEGFNKIIIIDQVSNPDTGLLFRALAQIAIGFSNLLITVKTITIYWKTKNQ